MEYKKWIIGDYMKKRFIIILLVSLPLGLFFLYVYPIQRALAMNKFYKYIELQGASVENIYDMEVYKDYKIGGYDIMLRYKDDNPDNRYEYHYTPIYFYDNKILGNDIMLIVHTKYIPKDKIGNKMREEAVKYKPLEDYR